MALTLLHDSPPQRRKGTRTGHSIFTSDVIEVDFFSICSSEPLIRLYCNCLDWYLHNTFQIHYRWNEGLICYLGISLNVWYARLKDKCYVLSCCARLLSVICLSITDLALNNCSLLKPIVRLWAIKCCAVYSGNVFGLTLTLACLSRTSTFCVGYLCFAYMCVFALCPHAQAWVMAYCRPRSNANIVLPTAILDTGKGFWIN